MPENRGEARSRDERAGLEPATRLTCTTFKHLPFELRKSDGEFVRNLGDSHKDQLVVRSLAQIGKKTVAEHVEDDATLEIVRASQGYGIARPRRVLAEGKTPTQANA